MKIRFAFGEGTSPCLAGDTLYASFVGVGDRIYVAARSGAVAVVKNADTLRSWLPTDSMTPSTPPLPSSVVSCTFGEASTSTYIAKKQPPRHRKLEKDNCAGRPSGVQMVNTDVAAAKKDVVLEKGATTETLSMR